MLLDKPLRNDELRNLNVVKSLDFSAFTQRYKTPAHPRLRDTPKKRERHREPGPRHVAALQLLVYQWFHKKVAVGETPPLESARGLMQIYYQLIFEKVDRFFLKTNFVGEPDILFSHNS